MKLYRSPDLFDLQTANLAERADKERSMERSHSRLMHEVNERLHTVFAIRGLEEATLSASATRHRVLRPSS